MEHIPCCTRWITASFAAILLMSSWHVALASTGDYLFNNKQQITAPQLVQAVLAHNPDLSAMRSAFQAAQARIVQASALDDPMLSYAIAPGTVGAAGLDFGHKVEISQKLPWPGKRRLRGEAAGQEADAAREDIASLRLKLAAATKSAFADWYYIYEAIRINGININLLQAFRRIAEVRYSAGLASKQDALRASVEFTMLEHQGIVLERQRREVLTHINTLLNRTPDRHIPLPAVLSVPGKLSNVEVLRLRAIKTRPELKALAAHIRAVGARTSLARKAFYPDIKLTGGFNSLWNRHAKRFTMGIGMNLPFDQGKRHASVDESRAEMQQLEWEMTSTTKKIEGEVQRDYDRIEESLHILTLFRKQLLPLAKENMETARADYQAGNGDFLTLISAEKNLMQIRLELERTRADYYRRLAALERAVGGSLTWSLQVGDTRSQGSGS